MIVTQANYFEYGTPRFRRLSDDQLKRVHHASLEILDRTGVCLYDEEALDLMRKAGLPVDEGNRVRIPPYLVEWALSVAPKRITIYDREGRPVMPLERNNVSFGPDSDCLRVLDHHSGGRRQGTIDYIEKGIRVADALPNIDFLMSLCVASEIKNQAVAGRYQMRAMLENTTKSGGYHYVFGMLSHGGGPGVPPRIWGARSELCHYYYIPAFGLGGAGNSKVVDAQAGVQAAWTLLVEALAGANIVHNVSYTSGASLHSLELLVICDESIESFRRFMTGMEVNEETLALDVIDEVGPHGHYLDHKHTLKHFREESYPELLDTGKYEDWVAAGSKTWPNGRASGSIRSWLNAGRSRYPQTSRGS